MMPGDAAGYIHAAYCLHELGQTDEAREMLQLKGGDQVNF